MVFSLELLLYVEHTHLRLEVFSLSWTYTYNMRWYRLSARPELVTTIEA